MKTLICIMTAATSAVCIRHGEYLWGTAFLIMGVLLFTGYTAAREWQGNRYDDRD